MNNYSPNDVVMWNLDLNGRPWSVEYQHTDNAHPYGLTVIVQGSRTVKAMSEELRPPTFGEFAWFKHPRTGGWMSGKTRGYMAVIIHLFALALFVIGIRTSFITLYGKFIEFDALPLLGSAIGVLVALGYWIGTHNNWRQQYPKA